METTETKLELNNKQKAVAGVGVLMVVFLICSIWYLATHQPPKPVGQDTLATSTTPTETATGPKQIIDTGKYYEIKAAYPSTTLLKQTTGPKADAAAVTVMRTFLEQEIARFKDNGNFANLTAKDVEIQGLSEDRKYALDAEYKTYQGAHTVSYVYTLYSDTLGAHPNTYYRTFTFDTATGQSLDLDDLFVANSGYLDALSSIARTDLPVIIKNLSKSDPDLKYIESGTFPEPDSFQSWYLEGKNLVLVFPPYQVGPYALGTVLDPIPLSKLSSSLKATYVP